MTKLADFLQTKLPKNAVKNIKSVPSIRLSDNASPSTPSVSIARIVNGCCGGLIPPG